MRAPMSAGPGLGGVAPGWRGGGQSRRSEGGRSGGGGGGGGGDGFDDDDGDDAGDVISRLLILCFDSLFSLFRRCLRQEECLLLR